MQDVTAQDTLHWRKDYRLSFDDFRGKPASDSWHKAMTSSGIAYSYSLPDTGIYFIAIAFFNRNKSWTKTPRDGSILNHEQGHFDITEIYARRLATAIRNLSQDKKIFKQTITSIADQFIAAKNEFQKKYDLETTFGTNAAAQLKWNDIISKELEK
jgi:hypothetical protein